MVTCSDKCVRRLANSLDDELGRAVLEGVVLVEVDVGAWTLVGQVHEDVRQGNQTFPVRGYGHLAVAYTRV